MLALIGDTTEEDFELGEAKGFECGEKEIGTIM